MVKRKSNMELLRIFSIFFIVVFHCTFKSGISFGSPLDLGEYITKLFWMLGELGVNLFVLISGYFMVNSKFSWKKVILLVTKVTIYNAVLTLVAMKLGVVEIVGAKQIFLAFFPLTMNRYWFFNAYIVLYILSPFLNVFIKSASKETYKKLLITVLVLYSVIPTVFGVFYNNTETLLYYNRLIWLIIIYLIGGYIKTYSVSVISSLKKSTITFLGSLAVIAASVFIIDRFLPQFQQIGISEPAYFWPPNTVPLLMLSMGLFGIFMNINLPYSKVINAVASTTFGVYLLHDGVLCYYIWKTVFKVAEIQGNLDRVAYILGVSLIVFSVATLIDFVYVLIEKRLIVKLLNPLCFVQKRKESKNG